MSIETAVIWLDRSSPNSSKNVSRVCESFPSAFQTTLPVSWFATRVR